MMDALHVIGTAGHVDHGKSTLVKALTGIDPDRLEEERERGLTIDLGFAWWTLPSGREVGVVDVPGHERFIRNMLAGVGGIDAALFVVAADEGWKPQSTEHLAILDFLQVRAGVVALTKADLVDADMLELARDEVGERLAGTALGGAPVVAVSSTTRAGLDDLQSALDELLAAAGPAADRDRPRLFVDRSFTIAGAGTVVTGTLTGGALRVGDEVQVLPGGDVARVRTLQTHRRSIDEAVPGSRVAANLVGLGRSEVVRGDAVVRPGTWRTTDTFAARIRAARDLRHPIAERGAYELYVGAAEVPCRLKFLEEPGPGETGIAAGEGMLVQVFCMRALPLDPGDRFIVRDVGRWETVAGGVVLDHFPGRVRRGDPQVLDRLRVRETSARDSLVVQLVSERRAVAVGDLGWLTGLGAQEVQTSVDAATSSGRATSLPGFLLDTAYADELRTRALAGLGEHHESHRLDAGMPREALRASLALDARIFSELVDAWTRESAVVADGAVLRLPGHGAALSPADEAVAAAALQALREGATSPPELSALGMSPELVKALERRGDLVVIAPGLAYESGVMAGVERRVVELISSAGPATVAHVRDAVGTTRKYAVPLLEHLDTSGVTRRQGDKRVLGPRGRKIAEGLSPPAR